MVPLPLEFILRSLIAADIVLTIALLSLGMFGDPFLPRDWFDSSDESWTNRDRFLLAVFLLNIALLIISWVGLFANWRNARRLYTVTWILLLLLIFPYGPDIASGPVQVIDTLGLLVGGTIFGLLYFTDLRHRYEASTPAC